MGAGCGRGPQPGERRRGGGRRRDGVREECVSDGEQVWGTFTVVHVHTQSQGVCF